MSSGMDLISTIASRQDVSDYQKLHWSGTFADYLDLVRSKPMVTRTAHQRVYDMIMSYGTDEVTVNKEKVVQYRFFDDPMDGGNDAVFGLEKTLMNLVNVFKSAAQRYGTERRVLLLHGPVGSSKSTIVRLLKKGLEHLFEDGRGSALYVYLAGRAAGRGRALGGLPDARRAAAADSAGEPGWGAGGAEPVGPGRRLSDHDRGGAVPLLPVHVQRADGAV